MKTTTIALTTLLATLSIYTFGILPNLKTLVAPTTTIACSNQPNTNRKPAPADKLVQFYTSANPKIHARKSVPVIVSKIEAEKLQAKGDPILELPAPGSPDAEFFKSSTKPAAITPVIPATPQDPSQYWKNLEAKGELAPAVTPEAHSHTSARTPFSDFVNQVILWGMIAIYTAMFAGFGFDFFINKPRQKAKEVAEKAAYKLTPEGIAETAAETAELAASRARREYERSPEGIAAKVAAKKALANERRAATRKANKAACDAANDEFSA